MADFREELYISRKPSFFPQYSWCHTKTDLADDTVEILDFGEEDSIGKICQLIDDFEPTEQDVKLGIKSFLETDTYDSMCEY